MLVPIIVFVAVAIVFYVLSAPPEFTIKSNWNHYFDDMQIPSAVLYPKIIARLHDWKVEPNITKVTQKQSHIFSAEREYLRIAFHDHVFFFGCYQFGKGTYASWWLGVNDETWVNKIPVVSLFMGKDRKYKTFYQRDIEAMYRSTVHTVILAVLEEVGQQKGARSLSPDYRQFNSN